MLGLGETHDEVVAVMADLRAAGCDMITLGQYLRPSSKHLPVTEFVTPDEFDALAAEADGLGFSAVASAPFVRSSYHAGEMAEDTSA
jgi:lipoic acid synthetase